MSDKSKEIATAMVDVAKLSNSNEKLLEVLDAIDLDDHLSPEQPILLGMGPPAFFHEIPNHDAFWKHHRQLAVNNLRIHYRETSGTYLTTTEQIEEAKSQIFVQLGYRYYRSFYEGYLIGLNELFEVQKAMHLGRPELLFDSETFAQAGERLVGEGTSDEDTADYLQRIFYFSAQNIFQMLDIEDNEPMERRDRIYDVYYMAFCTAFPTIFATGYLIGQRHHDQKILTGIEQISETDE